MKNSEKLCRLKNGDAVLWRGELVFAEADDEHVEPWVKIVTGDGIEGWSRLFYLHPEEYQGMEFEVIGKE
ncbi:SH3 domain-containing protein [Lachnospiraceae bacterium 46-15]